MGERKVTRYSFMRSLLEKSLKDLSDGTSLAASRHLGARARNAHFLGERKHLVERLPVGDEPALTEGRACELDLLRGKLEVARDRAKSIVAQPLTVTDQDEEEVQEDLVGLEAQ